MLVFRVFASWCRSCSYAPSPVPLLPVSDYYQYCARTHTSIHARWHITAYSAKAPARTYVRMQTPLHALYIWKCTLGIGNTSRIFAPMDETMDSNSPGNSTIKRNPDDRNQKPSNLNLKCHNGSSGPRHWSERRRCSSKAWLSEMTSAIWGFAGLRA